MAHINQFIENLKCDEGFIQQMDRKLGFIPNEVEGLGELATYLEDVRHIQIISDAMNENGIECTDGFMSVIYGSIGSSSSQILIPRNVSREILVQQCFEKFNLYHSEMDISEADITDMFDLVNIQIKGNDWSVILIPNNALFDKFIPLYVLTELYIITQLPICISNAIAHSFYAKNKTFLDTRPELAKRTASLEQLFDDDIVNDRLNKDMVPSSQFIVKYRDDVFSHCYDGGLSKDVSDAYKYIILIPKTKVDGTFINNSWDQTLWYPTKVGGLSIDGYIPIIDIGGGRTNTAYLLNDVSTMTKNIIKEMKSSYPEQMCFPICSGKIRTTIERHMIYSDNANVAHLEAFEIIPTYIEYFEKSKFVTLNNGKPAVYLYVI